MNTQATQATYSPKYWNHQGNFQKELDTLWSKLVPSEGKAKTMHGELLRCATKLYYDVFNNGFGNADVLGYQVDFVMNFEQELLQNDLSKSDWSTVKKGFKSGVYGINEDQEFIKSLDFFIDASVKYCLTQE